MKKIFLFVCLALVIAVILFFSIPVPIVSHPDSSKIEWIMVNPDFGNPDSIPLDISISDDVEQEILEYLHQCTMRRKQELQLIVAHGAGSHSLISAIFPYQELQFISVLETPKMNLYTVPLVHQTSIVAAAVMTPLGIPSPLPVLRPSCRTYAVYFPTNDAPDHRTEKQRFAFSAKRCFFALPCLRSSFPA